jgi:hypothetical protein
MLVPDRFRRREGQAGSFAVEFALVLLVFLTVIFGTIELARAMYIFSTLQEVTRRAARLAANVDFRDEGSKDRVRQKAIFLNAPGTLIFSAPVTDRHIKIDYLALIRNGDGSMTPTPIPPESLPAGPGRNRFNCSGNPNSATCVRLVRVRICAPGGTTCTPVRYQPIVPLITLPINLPMSTAIVTSESLGFVEGMTPSL